MMMRGDASACRSHRAHAFATKNASGAGEPNHQQWRESYAKRSGWRETNHHLQSNLRKFTCRVMYTSGGSDGPKHQ